MIKTTFFAALLVIFCATTAMSQPMMGPGMRNHSKAGMGKMMADLNLTADQQKQMRSLHNDIAKKRIQTQSKIRLARIDLRELMAADKPNKSAIEKVLKTISDLEYQQKLDQVDHLIAVKGILTQEQLKTWEEHRNERPGRMRDGSGPHMRRHQGFRGNEEPRGMEYDD